MAERAAVTALIADDEPVARAGLKRMLGEIDWIECIAEAGNGPAALTMIEQLRPELVLMDIQMPGLLGTELIARLSHRPFVVFTTAFAEHAVTAFELGALDYVLKPFGPERLRASLDRVRAAIGEPLPPTLDRLSEALSQSPLKRIFVRSGRAILPLAVDSIHCFEAVGDYIAVHCAEHSHLLHLSLNRLQERLDPARFARIHRTYIVNLDRVLAFKRQLSGALVAQLADGRQLPVSRSKAQELRGLAL